MKKNFLLMALSFILLSNVAAQATAEVSYFQAAKSAVSTAAVTVKEAVMANKVIVAATLVGVAAVTLFAKSQWGKSKITLTQNKVRALFPNLTFEAKKK